MTKNLFKSFYELDKTFGKTGEFDEQIVHKLAQPLRMSKCRLLLVKIGLPSFYWNSMLKKNNAFEKRFDKPYAN